jgi:ribosomal protein S18 acetylase RimI-like enzyme
MIRPATAAEIPAIVRIHWESFPAFFLTFLGAEFLTLFYRAVLEDPEGILLVAAEPGDPVGFVAGVLSQSNFYRRLLERRKWSFAAAALGSVLKRPSIVPRLWRALRRPAESRAAAADACLMSLAVSPRAERRGLGGQLVDAFCQTASMRGVTRISLTTDQAGNDRVNRFYERQGFRLARLFQTPEGRAMNEYVREVGERGS